jgi:hypothetical protein
MTAEQRNKQDFAEQFLQGNQKKKVLFITMHRLRKCLHLYIGCETNRGQLVGIKKEYLLIQGNERQGIVEYDARLLGESIFLYLQQLNDLTEEQSRELIKHGLAIGRPNGYTFSNEAFLYLLSLHVDLFGLIPGGYAKNSRTISQEES